MHQTEHTTTPEELRRRMEAERAVASGELPEGVYSFYSSLYYATPSDGVWHTTLERVRDLRPSLSRRTARERLRCLEVAGFVYVDRVPGRGGGLVLVVNKGNPPSVRVLNKKTGAGTQHKRGTKEHPLKGYETAPFYSPNTSKTKNSENAPFRARATEDPEGVARPLGQAPTPPSGVAEEEIKLEGAAPQSAPPIATRPPSDLQPLAGTLSGLIAPGQTGGHLQGWDSPEGERETLLKGDSQKQCHPNSPNSPVPGAAPRASIPRAPVETTAITPMSREEEAAFQKKENAAYRAIDAAKLEVAKAKRKVEEIEAQAIRDKQWDGKTSSLQEFIHSPAGRPYLEKIEEKEKKLEEEEKKFAAAKKELRRVQDSKPLTLLQQFENLCQSNK